MQKRIVLLIVALTLLLFGCSEKTKEEVNLETKEEVEEKSDFEKAIEEKDIDYLHSYVQENTYDLSIEDEEKIRQFREAILILFNSDTVKNKEMLLLLFHNLIKNSNPLLAAKLITVLENEENQHYLKNFEGIATSYLESLKNFENHDTEVAIAQGEYDKLASLYPFPTDFTGDKLMILNSVIKQKISENEYVIEIYNENMILNTFETVFNSSGRFSIQAIEGPQKSYTRLDGFTEILTIWYEVPNLYLEQANELLAAKKNINEVRSKIDTYDAELEASTMDMGIIINNVFDSNPVKSVSKNIFEESNGFSIYGLKLGDDSSRVDEILGEDFTLETDIGKLQFTEASEIRYYEDIEIYLYDNKINRILMYISEEDFKEKILNKSKYEKILAPPRTEGGKERVIIYNPNTTELIMSEHDPTGEFFFRLRYDDGNFSSDYYGGGDYKPYTE